MCEALSVIKKFMLEKPFPVVKLMENCHKSKVDYQKMNYQQAHLSFSLKLALDFYTKRIMLVECTVLLLLIQCYFNDQEIIYESHELMKVDSVYFSLVNSVKIQ